ncbi:DUF11 domain-containing protein [Pseudanabaenaceae cyanobacterium LEGE 13415]|nr:DUF11 domain-containing protein [Pseudanabaenaceae cyanobacterium LEGE 13415]
MSCLLQLLLTLKRSSRLLGKVGTFLAFLCLAEMQVAQAEGSRTLYPSGASGNRANIEWRDDTLNNGTLKRRTLLKVYANAGENILLGSSSVGTGQGDIHVFDPGRVTGAIGNETIPTTADFRCTTQRTALGNTNRGRILSRTVELAGPQSISGTGNTSGYVPCYYTAPITGVYSVVFLGPLLTEANTNGLINTLETGNNQGNSVAAWDVTVRSSDINSTQDFTGRLFTYYFSLFTGRNGRPLYFSIFPVTNDGYQYKLTLRGLDPYGFVLYGNQVGFFDSDGKTPLYRDLLGQDDKLSSPDGGVSFARPQFATFVNPPDTTTLASATRYDVNGNVIPGSIPIAPEPPNVSTLSFAGTVGQNTSIINQGGTFTFNSATTGNYELVISRDGVNFDPTNSNNRVLRGVMLSSGQQTVTWDGQDNSGNAFPVGSYPSRIKVHAGEYHFPMLDAENNAFGGPTIELLNAVNPLGNFQAFYDDRGYRTLSGAIVGTPGQILCSGMGATPSPTHSNPITGFDTRTNDRAYGVNRDAGTGAGKCAGSFGDTKGLDIWTYFPSNIESTPVNIINNPPANLRLVKRITALNNTTFTDVIDDPADPSDDGSRNWTANYLTGRTGRGITAADSVPVKPGDILEYTIYFLSDGGAAAQNVTLCDLIPSNTTFVPNTFNSNTPKDSGASTGDFGLRLTIDNSTVYLSNADDAPDRGRYYAPGTSAPCGNNGTPVIAPNGAVTVRLNTVPNATTRGTPNSFGFIRFRARVN